MYQQNKINVNSNPYTVCKPRAPPEWYDGVKGGRQGIGVITSQGFYFLEITKLVTSQ